MFACRQPLFGQWLVALMILEKKMKARLNLSALDSGVNLLITHFVEWRRLKYCAQMSAHITKVYIRQNHAILP